jgi:hypothetical protein
VQMMNIDCQEVASAEEVDARGWLNILWMSSMWLISSSNGISSNCMLSRPQCVISSSNCKGLSHPQTNTTGGCSVRDIMNLHRTQLHALIAELAPIAQLAHMRDFDHLSGAGEDVLGLPVRDAHVAGNDLLQVDTVMCDMEARSRQYLVGAIVPCKQGALRQLQWLNGSHSPLSLCAHTHTRTRAHMHTHTHTVNAYPFARAHTHAHTHTHTVMFEQELPAQDWIISSYMN